MFCENNSTNSSSTCGDNGEAALSNTTGAETESAGGVNSLNADACSVLEILVEAGLRVLPEREQACARGAHRVPFHLVEQRALAAVSEGNSLPRQIVLVDEEPQKTAGLGLGVSVQVLWC